MNRVIGYRVVRPDNVLTREQAEQIAARWRTKFASPVVAVELREITPCVWTKTDDDDHDTSCGVYEVQVLHGHGADSTRYCPFCGGPVEVADA